VIPPKLPRDRIPNHVALVMDGNGRWAKARGLTRTKGHEAGEHALFDIVEGAAELGIQYLTLYAFSTENWDRPAEEVSGLMQLLVTTIRKEVPTLNKNNIRLHVIGDLNMLPEFARNELTEALEMTSPNTGLNLVMALSYSGRWELVEAVRRIARSVEQGDLHSDQINEQTLQEHLSTHAFPDPELMIRTSGEYRISNFLPYQLAYAELYFTEVCWPDFRKQNLYDALLDYQQRERRFGKISEQL